MQCRQADGKLSSPTLCQGQLSVLDAVLFSAGQCKPMFHSELHSISSSSQDVPVTLVLRQKDKSAMSRFTTCCIPSPIDTETNVDQQSLWPRPDEDRPATQLEKLAMLQVRDSFISSFVGQVFRVFLFLVKEAFVSCLFGSWLGNVTPITPPPPALY